MKSEYLGGFEGLEVWKEARKFRHFIYDFAKTLPKHEEYRLGDQLIRSSRSITSNIAEGYGRFHFQENIRFCRMARGSLSETLDHLICSFDLKYLDQQKLEVLRSQHNHILKLMNGYIAFLKRKKNET